MGASGETRRTSQDILRNIGALPAPVIVSFSTIAVYGTCIAEGRKTPRPDSSYAKAKLALEEYAQTVPAAPGRRHYILRLGHVYGAGQWVSREIVENIRREGFGLPFDGRTASNTIWVRHAARTVCRLLEGGTPSGIYDLTDTPNQSWRQLYDLHTAALGLPPVPSLPDDVAEQQDERSAAGTGLRREKTH